MSHPLPTKRPRIISFLESETIALEGTDLAKVYVHRELLSEHCGAGGDCWWSCFHSDTIKRLVEYLYQGDYTGPLPVSVPPVTPASTVFGEEATPLATDSLVYSGSLDYEGVLLGHAELFILAKTRKIGTLAKLCLARLFESMSRAEAEQTDSTFSENMVELLRYSYSHCYMNDSCAWGELQEIVSNAWVERIEWILEMPGSSLLSGEGKLVKDLMIGTVKRLIDADSRCGAQEGSEESVVEEPVAAPQQGYNGPNLFGNPGGKNSGVGLFANRGDIGENRPGNASHIFGASSNTTTPIAWGGSTLFAPVSRTDRK
ncbi:unnamed protein product [Tuber melanosporum]|jgi:hypothetical protein|uniref:(Perigord truffle) hypothetical protein n=1 Tax=Tuber melanosporum (strain Mel28) TaxID=656061 RepID=D5GB93_TUBMM|nr:uncharacterized protein GSTUM_00000526001 [Tuber melanosporum]CAZ81786.1 unnamed protein product [Tuber melanosporum]